MLNYFNYFTEIEQYFQSKRETFTLLNSLDWVLMESWKESGIPLDLVLKGIDRAFSRPNAKRKIGSLAYCTKAIADVCDENKDLRVDKPELPEVSADEFSTYLGTLAAAVAALERRFPEFTSRFSSIAESIRGLNRGNLRGAEQVLTALEEKVIALLKIASDEGTMLQLKREVDSDLAPFRSTMTAEQLTMLEQQLWRRKIMERYEVPRLSLFYLM